MAERGRTHAAAAKGEEIYNASCLACHGGRTGGTIDDATPRQDINAVVAYIKTMWLPGQRDAQAGFTKEMCIEGSI